MRKSSPRNMNMEFTSEDKHPSDDLLSAYAVRNVEDDLGERLKKHIAFCDRCSNSVYRKKVVAMTEAGSEPMHEYIARIIRDRVTGLLPAQSLGQSAFAMNREAKVDLTLMARLADVSPKEEGAVKEGLIALCDKLEDGTPVDADTMWGMLEEEFSAMESPLFPKGKRLLETLLGVE